MDRIERSRQEELWATLGSYNFDNREDMDAWFATGAFDRNFVGVPVDPDEMVRQRDAGVPAPEILQGSYE